MPEIERPLERRGAIRHDASICCALETSDGLMDVVLLNLSTEGILFRCPMPLAPHAEIRLTIPGLGARALRIVRKDVDRFGARFEVPLTCCDVADALAEEVVVSNAF